tara:strand:- start:885 stop:1046 length:162 start_codon:yes stop_codon:yes gene_type:complete
MESKKRSFIIGSLSGVFGGVLGAVSGSNSLIVVGTVSAVWALFFAWGFNGMIN